MSATRARRAGREIQVRFDAWKKPIVADVDHRLIAVQDHGGVVLIGHIHLRQSACDGRFRFERLNDTRREFPAIAVGVARAGLRRQAVDDREIQVGIPRTVGVDHCSTLVDEEQLTFQTSDTDRLSLGDDDFHGRRQRSTKRRVTHPG